MLFHRTRVFRYCLFFLWVLLAACSSQDGASPGSTSTAGVTPTMTALPPTQIATAIATPSPTPVNQVVAYTGHAGPVIEAVWSPDGTLIVSASTDGSAQVWKLQSL